MSRSIHNTLNSTRINLNNTTRPNTNNTSSGISKEDLEEFELDEAYNNYLTSKLKLLIVKKSIAKHKEQLEGQLMVQTDFQIKIADKLIELQRELDANEKEQKMLKVLDVVGSGAKTLKTECEIDSLREPLLNVVEYLKIKSDSVEIKGIKPIKTQQEYDEFMDAMERCNTAMEKILTTIQGSKDLVKQASDVIKEYKNTVKNFKEAAMDNRTMLKKIKHNTLKKMSETLAEKH